MMYAAQAMRKVDAEIAASNRSEADNEFESDNRFLIGLRGFLRQRLKPPLPESSNRRLLQYGFALLQWSYGGHISCRCYREAEQEFYIPFHSFRILGQDAADDLPALTDPLYQVGKVRTYSRSGRIHVRQKQSLTKTRLGR